MFEISFNICLFIYFSVKYAIQSNDCHVFVNKQSIYIYLSRAGLSDYSWEHIPSWTETRRRDIRKSRGTTWIYELEESLINGQWWISDGIFIEIS